MSPAAIPFEVDLHIVPEVVPFFDPETNTCPIVPACLLRRALSQALEGFFAALDAYSLADLAAPTGGRKLSEYLQISPAAPA